LHSTPKRHSKDENPPCRLDALEDDDPARTVPEIDSFIAQCFEAVGMFLSGGMGMTPLTWVEMDSFLKRSGYLLNGWESEQIIKMSKLYCSMVNAGKEIDCPAPHNLAATDETALERNRVIVANKFKRMKENRASFKGKVS